MERDSIRIVAWNCQGGFRQKWRRVVGSEPDVLVVPECEPLDFLDAPVLFDPFPMEQSLRFARGASPKGLAVFATNGWRLAVDNAYDERFAYVVPLIASRENHAVTIIAVWGMPSPGRGDYPERLHEAVSHYADLLREPVVMVGDFNSNTVFDAAHRSGSHSELVARLAASGVVSLYHERTGEPQGGESQPTFFMNRNRAKPYHLDFCFASRSLHGAVREFGIGSPDDWLDASDHLPLAVTFALTRPAPASGAGGELPDPAGRVGLASRPPKPSVSTCSGWRRF